ncbi:MAG: type II toxin-antitoxin system VapC family toxin [Candidatus Riflebacteria bacterium]|nr:type II toxin-antitoxin system VapC family toxin [Candidatus Riflebacteria bacterium]
MNLGRPRYFLDTSFVLAVVNRKDKHHDLAVGWEARLLAERARLLTHQGVLIELGDGLARLPRRELGCQILERLAGDSRLVIAHLEGGLFRRAVELYLTRPDKEWGLTDCLSFVLMTDLKLKQALTADEHFVQAGFRALLREEQAG